MIATRKINNLKVEPLVKNAGDKRPFKYSKVLPHPYNILYLAAKKNSGKTVLITNLIKWIAYKKNTIIRYFSTSLQNDKDLVKFIDDMREAGYIFETYSSLAYKNKNNEKYKNILEKQIDEINEFVGNKKKMQKFLQLKDQIPLVIYIFDDFRIALRENKLINDISSRNRHLKTVLIYSSQRFNDVSPIVRINTNILILFKGMRDIDLEKVYDELVTEYTINYEQFLRLYKDATEEQYGFLYIDSDNQIFRKNMNEEYDIDALKDIIDIDEYNAEE